MFLTRVPCRIRRALAVAVVASPAGCAGSDGTETERYADKLQVPGFTQVKAGYSDGARRSYVGPAGTAVPTVTGPGLGRDRGSTDWSYSIFSFLAIGHGSDPGTGRCQVTVFEVEDPQKAVSYLGSALSERQRAQVRAGASRVLQVETLCDAQADR
ncbi:hypothetical protein [Micromonospora auratinigra]|uniref:Uncharacterized protein n=1 Tax=Micromonospora auratinigra TaxID=261654 RepID=A0A1A8Z5B7_9ACTN|nr:hypothetical protein [Micromonospora auratinigra]SBT38999.1 hypothetical protein GA0070611_0747 [Micromonospora auratinigra]